MYRNMGDENYADRNCLTSYNSLIIHIAVRLPPVSGITRLYI